MRLRTVSRLQSAEDGRHGTHIRSQKARDVRALEPHGQAIHPDCQGHRHRGACGGARSRVEPDAAPRAAERPRGEHAEGQDGGGHPARLGQGGGRTTRRSSTKATRRTASRFWWSAPPTIRPGPWATCATSSRATRAIWAPPGA